MGGRVVGLAWRDRLAAKRRELWHWRAGGRKQLAVVSAAGYNSVHEAVLAEVPTLWVPNLNTQTDDQAARAGFLAAQGAGLSLENPGPAELAEALAQMASADERDKMAQRCQELSFGNGAQAAADIIHQIITGEKP